MTERQPRRHRGWIDDAMGGAVTFAIELGIVIALGVVAVIVAAVVLALV